MGGNWNRWTGLWWAQAGYPSRGSGNEASNAQAAAVSATESSSWKMVTSFMSLVRTRWTKPFRKKRSELLGMECRAALLPVWCRSACKWQCVYLYDRRVPVKKEPWWTKITKTTKWIIDKKVLSIYQTFLESVVVDITLSRLGKTLDLLH